MPSNSGMSDSLQPHRLLPARLLCPQDSPGKNTGMGSHPLLQRIFPTQGSDLDLLHFRQILCHLSNQGSQSVPKRYKLFIKRNRKTLIHRKQSYSYQRGKVDRDKLEVWYKQIYTKYITIKDPLYSTGNNTQHSVTIYKGKKI